MRNIRHRIGKKTREYFTLIISRYWYSQLSADVRKVRLSHVQCFSFSNKDCCILYKETMPFTTEKLPRQSSCKLFEGVLISESLERHRYDVKRLVVEILKISVRFHSIGFA